MRRPRSGAGRVFVAAAGTLAIAGCGAGATHQPATPVEPAKVTVDVPIARFPASQRLAEHTDMVIAVRNLGASTIPDLAVTVCNVTCAANAPDGEGVSAQPFAQDLNGSNLESHSRPDWIVERAPGPCRFSCQAGGGGGDANSYTNTWTLGALKPGRTATFRWSLTAVSPGRHIVAWEVAGNLDGDPRAQLPNGSAPRGTFTVRISHAPTRSYINSAGQIVTVR